MFSQKMSKHAHLAIPDMGKYSHAFLKINTFKNVISVISVIAKSSWPLAPVTKMPKIEFTAFYKNRKINKTDKTRRPSTYTAPTIIK